MNLETLKNHRWMLIDDDAEVLAMLQLLLENLTDAVIECHSSPRSAYAAFSKAPADYELVLTDFEMPGMNGLELSRWLRAVSPTQKIILMTGSGRFTEATADRAGFNALLTKPIALEALKRALARAGVKVECACTH
jgi:CheY-like chemotaxis protein